MSLGHKKVHDLKTEAVVIAAPFSIMLGLLASALAIILASSEYIWTCAMFEFALVAMTLHIFYSMFRFKAVYAILISTVLGLGRINNMDYSWDSIAGSCYFYSSSFIRVLVNGDNIRKVTCA
ncbi:hypothetical protein POM88_035387 [Heracleum sosnowskyi]|uniref:Uncharacterized protein n=1 Tax=Heracleum sosnowskyi TaxID=360622 RepID=A0AAD8HNF2_9APIA|nr:hypothetical protein POM88_035387 [Heracleum sosnowskyi]